jgi:hypothetical protein
MASRFDKLRASLPDGYALSRWSPGDGQTRYRFHLVPSGTGHVGDYYADDGIKTVLGLGQAELYASGLRATALRKGGSRLLG